MTAPSIAFALLIALPLVAAGQTPVQEKASSQKPNSTDFETQVQGAGEFYDALVEKSTALLLEGKLDEANKLLLEAVPKKDRSAAHAFVLGNLLFDIDREIAYQLHDEANAKDPKNPLIQLEWALELHRLKKYAEAEKVYAELVAGTDAKNSQAHALHADCLLHLGRPKDAIAAWEAAEPRKKHSEIEESASWVYGKLSPETRRCRLIADVKAGKLDALEPLILLDLSFDRDLWNSRTNKEYLEHDLSFAAATLGKDTNRYKELELLSRAKEHGDLDLSPKRAKDDKKTEALKSGSLALGLLGEKPRLPEKSLVASHLFQKWVKAELASGPQLMQWFEKDLRARAESKTGDLEDWKLLAALYAMVDSPKLAEVDRTCFEKYGDPDFGGSLLASKGDALTSSDPVLVKLLAEHPEYPGIVTYALQCAEREKQPTAELIARYINAEFTHMFSYQDVNRGFIYLKKALEAAPK